MSGERLTWEQIMQRYPDQWVGMTDIVWNEDNANIESAVVLYTDKSKDELLAIQIRTNCKVFGRYTTPDNVMQIGVLG